MEPQVIHPLHRANGITDLWSPQILASLNGQEVKLARVKGQFTWHRHDDQDEMFMVLQGDLTIHFSGFDRQLATGDMLVVPRGMDHCPESTHGAVILLFEPVGTRNTGNITNEFTKDAIGPYQQG
ncbi:MAG: cupin domain-containing protein [Bacteroidetes bacterium]|nr:cupin domain-containing protein [Bacteroidota bacterium]